MTNTDSERRQSTRYTVPGKTIAITPHNLGQIIDISMEGCAIKYIGEDINLGADEYIDILMKQSKGNGYYMEKIPTKIVWEDSPDFSAFSTIVVKKVGMKFNDLTDELKTQIQKFIDTFGVVEA